MSEANWVDRASKRVDAWPVGPLAALLLGAATGFFCWAMPYSPLIGRFALIVAPALLAFVVTFAAFRWIDARDPGGIADEGDDQEDWLTRPSRLRNPPMPATEPRPVRPGARPVIIDAIDDDEAGPARISEGGWPLPLVDRTPRSLSVREGGAPTGAPAAGADELLLDAPLPQAPPLQQTAALPIEDLMARLALRIEGREAADGPAPPPPETAATESGSPSPPMSDAEALRAALADLNRMARRS